MQVYDYFELQLKIYMNQSAILIVLLKKAVFLQMRIFRPGDGGVGHQREQD